MLAGPRNGNVSWFFYIEAVLAGLLGSTALRHIASNLSADDNECEKRREKKPVASRDIDQQNRPAQKRPPQAHKECLWR
jgi:hypothetical protein